MEAEAWAQARNENDNEFLTQELYNQLSGTVSEGCSILQAPEIYQQPLEAKTVAFLVKWLRNAVYRTLTVGVSSRVHTHTHMTSFYTAVLVNLQRALF